MALLIDETKLKACKSDTERMILGLEALKDELTKDALERRNADIAETKKMVDDAMSGHEERMAERFPQFKMPGVEAGEKKGQFSIARAALAFRHNDPTYGALEYEVYQSKEHRDFISKAASMGVDTTGSFLVPAEVSKTFIDKLQPATIAFQLGVRRMDVGNVAALTFNRLTGNATAEWVGEMLSATKTDLAYAQYTVAPKALSAKTDLSNMLQLMANNEAEMRWMDNASLMFAQGIDRGILIGPATPSNKAPIGIAGTNGVQTSSSATLTYDKLVDFEDKLRTANAAFGKIGWAMSESQYTAVRKLKDTSNQPIVLRSLTAAGQLELFGRPLYTTTQMGTTGANTLAYGNWTQATLFQWFGGILLKRSDVSDNALDNDLTRIALRMYCDVGVDQPTAFVYASD